ncbi:SRPBCC family protein [Actinopolymorpha alba]|uniref:SRPBCC family protein n=1 Tax=Actinopolymorpha alba TaxID=533267 RepID=UPI00035F075D|nr:SRPBCC family protein [Actinopolymorpha alba]
MGRHRIDVNVQANADPDAVYALLVDGTTWPEWSPFESFELSEAGDPSGLGSVRVFRSRWRGQKIASYEQVVELIPGRRYGYALMSGLPLRDYRANVDLEPSNGGCSIHWHSTFDAKVPGTGWLYRRVLGDFIKACAEGLAHHATSLRHPTSS